MAICSWCHKEVESLHRPSNDCTTWAVCLGCKREYAKLPSWRGNWKTNAGILFFATEEESGRLLLLVGREKGGFCLPYGTADESDLDSRMVAIREASEETCYALGRPIDVMEWLKPEYERGLFLRWGIWAVDLGAVSREALQQVLRKHEEHSSWIPALRREPTKCEREMEVLRWIQVDGFLSDGAPAFFEAVRATPPGEEIFVPELAAQMRSGGRNFFTQFWSRLPHLEQFLEFRKRLDDRVQRAAPTATSPRDGELISPL